MGRGKKLIFLLCGLAVLVLACFGVKMITQHKETVLAEEEAALSSVMDLQVAEYDDITAMSWVYLDTELTLEKNEDGDWVCPEEPDCPINQVTAGYMCTAASSVTGTLYAEDVEDFSDYELAEPELTLTVTAGDLSRTYEVGAYSDLVGAYYMRVDGGSELYLEDGTLESYFWYDLYNLVDMESGPEDAEQYEALSVKSDYTTLSLFRSDEPLDYGWSDNFSWFSDAESILPVDAEEAEALCEELIDISWDSCVTWDASAADIKSYGLSDPQATVTLSYTDADGDTQSYAVQFGNYTDGDGVYARVKGSSMVYICDAGILDDFLFADTASMLPAAFLSLDTESVTAMMVLTSDAGMETDVYGEDEQAFLEDLSALNYVEVVTGLSGREELLTVELELENEACPTLTLRFSSYDSNVSLCDVNGLFTVSLSRTTVQSLAEDALALTEPADDAEAEPADTAEEASGSDVVSDTAEVDTETDAVSAD